MQTSPLKKEELFWKITLGLVLLVVGIGITGYIVAGLSARLMQDDYCYDVILGNRSFLEGQIHSYLREDTYSGNRFSLNLTMGLSEAAGSGWTIPLLPGFMIVLWAAGLYLVYRRLAQLGYFTTTRAESLLCALAVAFFTIVMAPNWEQVFYWRNGMLTYFAPILSMTWLAVLVLYYDRQSRWRGVYLAVILLLAFLAGGFSETATSVEVVALGLSIGFAWLTKRHHALPAQWAALAGALLALLLLAISPSTRIRMQELYGQPAPLSVWPFASFNGALQFYVATLYRPTLLYFSVFIFFVVLAAILVTGQKLTTLGAKEFWIHFFIGVVVTLILTWAAMAPSFYAESSPPGNRALIVPRFISILFAANIGFLVGRSLLPGLWNLSYGKHILLTTLAILVSLSTGLWLLLLQKHFEAPAYPDLRLYAQSHMAVIAGLLLAGLVAGALLARWFSTRHALTLILLLYLVQPVLMATRIYDQLPVLQKRAQLWDWREAQIMAQRKSGTMDIVVPALDSLASIFELSDRPSFWVNNCAQRYYKVNSIRAMEPVLNPAGP
jgi:hypothetical protein